MAVCAIYFPHMVGAMHAYLACVHGPSGCMCACMCRDPVGMDTDMYGDLVGMDMGMCGDLVGTGVWGSSRHRWVCIGIH